MKKILFLLLAFFMFSLYVIGQTSSYCSSGDCRNGFGTYVWAGDPKWAGDTYTGDWKNGSMEGQGTYNWHTGSKYVGAWKAGNMDGYGTYTEKGTSKTGLWSNGTWVENSNRTGCVSGNCSDGYGIYVWNTYDRYEGYWKNGIRSGSGTYYYPDGKKYVGNCENNKRNGYGIFTWENGEKYEGNWKDGNQDGYGTYHYKDGTVKTGNWKGGDFVGTDNTTSSTGCISGNCTDGYGTYIWKSGEKYVGNWVNDKRKGYGTNYFASGTIFEGYWSDDKRNGSGTQTEKDGTVKTGTWIDDVYQGSSGNNTNNTSATGCISGNCTDGYGTYIWKSGEKYVGNWVNDKRKGYGTNYFVSGTIFEGYWSDDKRNGSGTQTEKDGTVKTGTWIDDVYQGSSGNNTNNTSTTGCISGNCTDGYGTYIWESGEKYVGNWVNDKRKGYGTNYFASGTIFEGYWSDDKRNGSGTQTEKDGTVKTGTWIDDVYQGSSGGNTNNNKTGCISGNCTEGYGIYAFESGEKYEGYWKNDKRTGQGTNYYAKGDVYQGEWLDDQQHGFGNMTYACGDKYSGNYKFHKISGFGTYIFKDGRKYIGEWKEGDYDGQGTMYYADGTTKSGIWKNGEYIGPANNNNNSTSTTGCISGDCDNGYGTYVFASGEKYEGFWKSLKRDGQGTNYYATGAKGTGEWKDDKLQGFGTYDYEKTSKYLSYSGNYIEGQLNGQGTLIYKDGKKYTGSFKLSLFDGEGTMYYTDGTVKSGIWKDNEYVGKSKDNYGCITGNCSEGNGTYVWESGSKYIGDWRNGKLDGQGTFYNDNGDKYIGGFKNGNYEGKGTYTFAVDNRKYVGEWKNGKYDGNGTMYYSNGTSETGTWKDGLFVGENKIIVKSPVVSWLEPEYFTSTNSSGSANIKVCIESKSPLKKAQIYINDILKVSDASRGYTIVSSACDFTIERSIVLNQGENKIKVIVENESGQTTSDIRTITYNANQGESKFALVIGNGNYITSPLRNPSNDAKAIADELRSLGFEVMLYTDMNYTDMIRDIRSFGEKLASKKGVGLFYYAGHGIQMNGENYLVPVNAKIEKEQDVEVEAVNLKRLMGEMDYAGNDLNIIILDACRNNPFARSFRSSGNNGLATVTAPKGTFIAYATSPGSVAADGTAGNGLYTQELLTALKTPGLKLEDLFKKVRGSVYDKSNKQQVPWENSSIFGDFYFSK